MSSSLLLSGGLDRLSGDESSVKASGVGLVAKSLLNSLLGTEEPADNSLEHINDALEKGRLEEGLGELDDEVGHAAEEVGDTGVDEELVDGLVKLGSLLDGGKESVEVGHETLEEVDGGGSDLVDVQVDQSVTSILDELASGLQKTHQEVDVAGEVQEAHALVGIVGGKGAGSQGVDGGVLLDELGSVVAGDLEVLSSNQRVGGGGHGGGGKGDEGKSGELHYGGCCGGDWKWLEVLDESEDWRRVVRRVFISFWVWRETGRQSTFTV